MHELLSTSPKTIFSVNKAGSTPLDIISRLESNNKAQLISCLNKFVFKYYHNEVEKEERIEENFDSDNNPVSGSKAKKLVSFWRAMTSFLQERVEENCNPVLGSKAKELVWI